MKTLKKHKYKLLTLILSIVSIFTLFLGINKTYAYETNQFTYTIDTTNETFTTINNKQGIILEYNNTKYFNLIDNNLVATNDYILINFLCLDSNNNVINFTDSISYNAIVGQRLNQFSFIINNTEYSNNGIYTNINKLNIYSSTSNQIGFQITTNFNVKIFITNIDIVKPYDIGLSQYYETYYGQIEDNYNALLNDYNDLQDNYDTLEGNYNTLQDNYDTLEENYNNLQNEYTNLNNSTSSLWKNCQYFGIADNTQQYYDLTSYMINEKIVRSYEQLEQQNVIINNTIKLTNLYTNYDYTTYNFLITFNDEIDTRNQNNEIESQYWNYYVPTETLQIQVNTNLTLNNNEYISLCFGKYNSGANFYREYIDIQTIDLANNNYQINKELLLKKDSTFNFEEYNTLLAINIIFDKENASTDLFELYANANDYSIGYTKGYNEGIKENNTIEKYKNNELQEQINNKNRTIEEQNTRYEILETQYQDLNDRYNRISNPNNTLYSMVVSIADVPLHVFKQIFNFDILGINISTFVLSLVSLLIIIWLIKKII